MGRWSLFWEVKIYYAYIFVILFSEIIISSYKELNKNRDFSIIFLIEIFLFFLCQNNRKRVNKSFAFSCYENPRRCGDASNGSIFCRLPPKNKCNSSKFKNTLFDQNIHSTFLRGKGEHTDRQTEIDKYRPNRPIGSISENILLLYLTIGTPNMEYAKNPYNPRLCKKIGSNVKKKLGICIIVFEAKGKNVQILKDFQFGNEKKMCIVGGNVTVCKELSINVLPYFHTCFENKQIFAILVARAQKSAIFCVKK